MSMFNTAGNIVSRDSSIHASVMHAGSNIRTSSRVKFLFHLGDGAHSSA